MRLLAPVLLACALGVAAFLGVVEILVALGGAARRPGRRPGSAGSRPSPAGNGPMEDRVDVGCLPGVIIAQATHDERDAHVTAKPLDLMRVVVRICPPGGTVLDPFAGSGSTGVACAAEGRGFIGIEREAVYVEAARAHLDEAASQPLLFGRAI